MKKEIKVANMNNPHNAACTNPADYIWETEEGGGEEGFQKVFIGKVPIMLRSNYCILNGLSERDLYDVGECYYDQVKRAEKKSRIVACILHGIWDRKLFVFSNMCIHIHISLLFCRVVIL